MGMVTADDEGEHDDNGDDDDDDNDGDNNDDEVRGERGLGWGE